MAHPLYNPYASGTQRSVQGQYGMTSTKAGMDTTGMDIAGMDTVGASRHLGPGSSLGSSRTYSVSSRNSGELHCSMLSQSMAYRSEQSTSMLPTELERTIDSHISRAREEVRLLSQSKQQQELQATHQDSLLMKTSRDETHSFATGMKPYSMSSTSASKRHLAGRSSDQIASGSSDWLESHQTPSSVAASSFYSSSPSSSSIQSMPLSYSSKSSSFVSGSDDRSSASNAREDGVSSIPGLGDYSESSQPYSSTATNSSRPKYTSESATDILQRFGLSKEDMELFCAYPDDQITPANLPFLLRDIRIQKAKRAAVYETVMGPQPSTRGRISGSDHLGVSGGVMKHQEEVAPTIRQPSKVIDYGHSSKYSGGFVDEISGRSSSVGASGNDSESLLDSYLSSSRNRETLPKKTGLESRTVASRNQTSSTTGPSFSFTSMLSSITPPSKDQIQIPSQDQTTRTSRQDQTNHPTLSPILKKKDTDMRNIQLKASVRVKEPGADHLAQTVKSTHPPCIVSAMKPSKGDNAANDQTQGQGSLVGHKMQQQQLQYPHQQQIWPPVFAVPPPPPLPPHPPPQVLGLSDTTTRIQPPMIFPRPPMVPPPLFPGQMPPFTPTPTPEKMTITKKFPTQTMISDYTAATPRIFPHTCSLCNKECSQMKDWITHQNTSLHIVSCRRLRNEYPDWDGTEAHLSSAVSPSVGRDAQSSTSAQNSKQRYQDVSHRSLFYSRSRSRSPSPQRYHGNFSSSSRTSTDSRRAHSRSPHSSRHTHSSHRSCSRSRSPSPHRYHGNLSSSRTSRDLRKARSPSPHSSKHTRSSRRSRSRTPSPNPRHYHGYFSESRRTRLPSPHSSRHTRRLRSRSPQRTSPPSSSSSSGRLFQIRSHERRLAPERSSGYKQEETSAERLAKKLLETSAVHFTSDKSELKAMVQSLAPALLAEIAKLKSSSSSTKGGRCSSSPSTGEKHTFSASKEGRHSSSYSGKGLTLTTFKEGKSSSLKERKSSSSKGKSSSSKEKSSSSKERKSSSSKEGKSSLREGKSASSKEGKSTSSLSTKEGRSSSFSKEAKSFSPMKRKISSISKTGKSSISSKEGKSLSSGKSSSKGGNNFPSTSTRGKRPALQASSSSTPSSAEKKVRRPPPSGALLRLKGIPTFTNNEQLLAALECYGKTTMALLLTSLGEASVCFERTEDANTLLKCKNFTINGAPIKVVTEEENFTEEQKTLSNPLKPKTSIVTAKNNPRLPTPNITAITNTSQKPSLFAQRNLISVPIDNRNMTLPKVKGGSTITKAKVLVSKAKTVVSKNTNKVQAKNLVKMPVKTPANSPIKSLIQGTLKKTKAKGGNTKMKCLVKVPQIQLDYSAPIAKKSENPMPDESETQVQDSLVPVMTGSQSGGEAVYETIADTPSTQEPQVKRNSVDMPMDTNLNEATVVLESATKQVLVEEMDHKEAELRMVEIDKSEDKASDVKEVEIDETKKIESTLTSEMKHMPMDTTLNEAYIVLDSAANQMLLKEMDHKEAELGIIDLDKTEDKAPDVNEVEIDETEKIESTLKVEELNSKTEEIAPATLAIKSSDNQVLTGIDECKSTTPECPISSPKAVESTPTGLDVGHQSSQTATKGLLKSSQEVSPVAGSETTVSPKVFTNEASKTVCQDSTEFAKPVSAETKQTAVQPGTTQQPDTTTAASHTVDTAPKPEARQLHLRKLNCFKTTEWNKFQFKRYFSNVGTKLLMITQLPKWPEQSYTQEDLINMLSKHGYTHEDYLFILPQERTAFVGMNSPRKLLNLITDHRQNPWHLGNCKLEFYILLEEVHMAQDCFYESLMSLSKTPLVDAQLKDRMVFVDNVDDAEDLVTQMAEFVGISSYLPLMSKVFIEFKTVEDLDHFGYLVCCTGRFSSCHFKRLTVPYSNPLASGSQGAQPGNEDAVPNTNVIDPVLQGAVPPFWMPVRNPPFYFPTATPQFSIPAHKTITSLDDITAVTNCSPPPKIVMITGLPVDGYTHEDITVLAWPYLNKSVNAYFYCVVPLTFQRRAFVYFPSGLKCQEFVTAHVKKPFSVQGCELTLHVVVEAGLWAKTDEEHLYSDMLKWQKMDVIRPLTLTDKLLIVLLKWSSVDIVATLMEFVSNVTPICYCLPLANRVCFELPSRNAVQQTVMQYRLFKGQCLTEKQSALFKLKQRPGFMDAVVAFETVRNFRRRLHQLKSKGPFLPESHALMVEMTAQPSAFMKQIQPDPTIRLDKKETKDSTSLPASGSAIGLKSPSVNVSKGSAVIATSSTEPAQPGQRAEEQIPVSKDMFKVLAEAVRQHRLARESQTHSRSPGARDQQGEHSAIERSGDPSEQSKCNYAPSVEDKYPGQTSSRSSPVSHSRRKDTSPAAAKRPRIEENKKRESRTGRNTKAQTSKNKLHGQSHHFEEQFTKDTFPSDTDMLDCEDFDFNDFVTVDEIGEYSEENTERSSSSSSSKQSTKESAKASNSSSSKSSLVSHPSSPSFSKLEKSKSLSVATQSTAIPSSSSTNSSSPSTEIPSSPTRKTQLKKTTTDTCESPAKASSILESTGIFCETRSSNTSTEMSNITTAIQQVTASAITEYAESQPSSQTEREAVTEPVKEPVLTKEGEEAKSDHGLSAGATASEMHLSSQGEGVASLSSKDLHVPVKDDQDQSGSLLPQEPSSNQNQNKEETVKIDPTADHNEKCKTEDESDNYQVLDSVDDQVNGKAEHGYPDGRDGLPEGQLTETQGVQSLCEEMYEILDSIDDEVETVPDNQLVAGDTGTVNQPTEGVYEMTGKSDNSAAEDPMGGDKTCKDNLKVLDSVGKHSPKDEDVRRTRKNKREDEDRTSSEDTNKAAKCNKENQDDKILKEEQTPKVKDSKPPAACQDDAIAEQETFQILDSVDDEENPCPVRTQVTEEPTGQLFEKDNRQMAEDEEEEVIYQIIDSVEEQPTTDQSSQDEKASRTRKEKRTATSVDKQTKRSSSTALTVKKEKSFKTEKRPAGKNISTRGTDGKEKNLEELMEDADYQIVDSVGEESVDSEPPTTGMSTRRQRDRATRKTTRNEKTKPSNKGGTPSRKSQTSVRDPGEGNSGKEVTKNLDEQGDAYQILDSVGDEPNGGDIITSEASEGREEDRASMVEDKSTKLEKQTKSETLTGVSEKEVGEEEEEVTYEILDSVEDESLIAGPTATGGSEIRKRGRKRRLKMSTKSNTLPEASEKEVSKEEEEPMYQILDAVEEEMVNSDPASIKGPSRGQRKGTKKKEAKTEVRLTRKTRSNAALLGNDTEVKTNKEEKTLDMGDAQVTMESALVNLDEVSDEEEDYPDDTVEEEELRKKQAAAQDKQQAKEREQESSRGGEGRRNRGEARNMEEEEVLVTLDEVGADEPGDGDDEGVESNGRQDAGISEGELQALVTLDEVVGEEEEVRAEPSPPEAYLLNQENESGGAFNPETLLTLDETGGEEEEEAQTTSKAAKRRLRKDDKEERTNFVMVDEVREEEEVVTVRTRGRPRKRAKVAPVRKSTRGKHASRKGELED
ncbi:uncharacterized protein LOC130130564 [Lampris incognitus]|uniref:uncharacterized protein LOC130130564 n=1 Tax=Lampris incognitus TaxID=2546036 RepID=UPI0024B571EA|nr:uncharacterized protein LOC130130564 [Lampris incognitus]